MRIYLFIFLLSPIFFKISAQRINSDSIYHHSQISCMTKDCIVGINWHFQESFICSDNIYFPYNVFDSYPIGYFDFTGFIDWIQVTGPYMFLYQQTDNFTEWVNLGLYHYVGDIIGKRYLYFLEDNYNHIGFYYLDKVDSIKRFSEYRLLKIDCDSIFRQQSKIGLSSEQLSKKFWIQALSQNMDSAEVNTAIKNLDFEKFDNYYPIPISEAWRDTTYDYFKQVSKVFYLLLFKCKITYLEGAYIGFDLPNTNLNLNSDNAAERSFCKRVSIPYYPIVNIEDVEPYNPRLENK
jgi:hypothetical protein